MTLIVSKTTDEVFRRPSSSRDLSGVFLVVRLVARGVAEEGHRGEAAHSPTKGTYGHRDIAIDVEIDHLAQVAFVKFLHCKVISPPPFFSYFALWNRVTLHSPHPRS